MRRSRSASRALRTSPQRPRRTQREVFIRRFPESRFTQMFRKATDHVARTLANCGQRTSRGSPAILIQSWHSFPRLKLVQLPLSLAATLAALPSISEIPFLDSWFPYSNLWLQRKRSDGQAFICAICGSVLFVSIRGSPKS